MGNIIDIFSLAILSVNFREAIEGMDQSTEFMKWYKMEGIFWQLNCIFGNIILTNNLYCDTYLVCATILQKDTV